MKRRHAAAGYASGVLALALALALLLPGSSTAAAPLVTTAAPPATQPNPVPVRVGDHPGFGRLVFDLPKPVAIDLRQQGNRLSLRFELTDPVGTAPRLPRNVLALAGAAGGATITLADGAQVRHTLLGTRLVLDILDPPARDAAAPRPPSVAQPPRLSPTRPVATRPVPTRPVPTRLAPPQMVAAGAEPPRRAVPEPPAAAPSAAATTVAAPPPVPAAAAAPPTTQQPAPRASDPAEPEAAAATGGVVPPAPDRAAAALSTAPAASGVPTDPPSSSGASLALAATLLRPGPDGSGAAVLLPFSAGVGAAAFVRNGQALIVFDERRPLDLAALRGDPVFGDARLQVLPQATLLRLRPAPAGLALGRVAAGWTLTAAVPPAGAEGALQPRIADGSVLFPTDLAGRGVAIVDPDSGGPLLIGTVRAAGPAVRALFRTPGFSVLPTWQGVAVEPASDSVALRPAADGFRLSMAATGPAAFGALADPGAMTSGAAALTRRFDLPLLPVPALRRRLRATLSDAATAPPRARLGPRIKAAETMIALGMGAEAQALLALAVNDDPGAADDPGVLGLAAVGGLLDRRVAAAAAIDDPRLSGSDEVTFWRGVRGALAKEAGQDASPEAAVAFRATGMLLADYAEPLRAQLAPLVTETLAAGGETAAAARLLAALPDTPALRLARAMLLDARGDVDGALAAYDALSAGRDRLTRVRAATRAVELRLAQHRLGAAEAADALDRLVIAWRGDGRELALRQRAATLQAEAGHFRAAFADLRDAEIAWPDHIPALRAQLAATFARLLQDDALDRMTPLDLAALVEENADILPAGAAGDTLTSRLADRLMALELPNRAAAVLDRLVQAAPPGPRRAALGERLGEARLAADDPRGALAALEASAAAALPADIAAPRTLLLARALTRLGEGPRAVAALTALATPAADRDLADIQEGARDWPAAVAALQTLATRTVPASGTLDDAARTLLLRLAEAAAQAGDAATLAALGTREAARMAGGRIGAMFRLLTASPVAHIGDLPRATQETALARQFPSDLAALAPPSPAR